MIIGLTFPTTLVRMSLQDPASASAAVARQSDSRLSPSNFLPVIVQCTPTDPLSLLFSFSLSLSQGFQYSIVTSDQSHITTGNSLRAWRREKRKEKNKKEEKKKEENRKEQKTGRNVIVLSGCASSQRSVWVWSATVDIRDNNQADQVV